MHFHRMGGETQWPAARIGTWRLWDADVNWWNLEPSRGRWDFSRLDRYVAEAAQRQVELILPLSSSPTWASARPGEYSPYNPGAAAEPGDIRDWQNYVRTVATRYKGQIHHFELWNEVNERNHYTGSVDTLVRLAQEAQKILKEVDPGNQLIGPSVVGSDHQMRYLDDFFARGGAAAIDIVAYHFYVYRNKPEDIIPVVAKVRAVMQKHGVDKPLWNTEMGWAIANTDGTPGIADPDWKPLGQTQAAAYMARSFALAWALGVERNVWYAWDNYAMGFVEPRTRKTKVGGTAYANLVTHLNGARLSACASVDAVWTCSLTTPLGKPARLMWSEDDVTRVVRLPADWSVNTQVSSLETSVRLASHGKSSLTVGSVPRLLVKAR